MIVLLIKYLKNQNVLDLQIEYLLKPVMQTDHIENTLGQIVFHSKFFTCRQLSFRAFLITCSYLKKCRALIKN